MDPNLIRELASRREAPTLDFKETQYVWDEDGNLELAKDLMAIANTLSPIASPGYILIGVEEVEPEKTGRIVGIDPALHLDDAKMHDKVKYLLNRTPNFSYSVITIDSLSVGIFEIKPGGRPFYPLNTRGNRHKLVRFQAMYRPGALADVASPEQVIEWWREDNATELRIKALELEVHEAKLAVHGRIAPEIGVSNHGDQATHIVTVQNDGESPFRLVSARVRWRLDGDRLRHWVRENHGRLLRVQEFTEDVRITPLTLRPGVTTTVQAPSTGEGLKQRFAALVDTEGTHPPPPFTQFVLGQIEVDLEGNTGRAATIRSPEFIWRQ